MSNRLQPILDATRQDLIAKMEAHSLAELEKNLSLGLAPARRDFAAGLRAGQQKNSLAIIAEIKRRSPSMGMIAAADTDPAKQAGNYQSGGADCLSILTEPHYFNGSLDDMKAGRAAVTLPVLRKDFMINRWQLAETRLAGADAALLIVAALGAETSPMLKAATDYGLDVLVEVHDRAELDIAIDAGAKIIGVNNRNLTNFTIDLAVAESLYPHIPNSAIKIAESGLENVADFIRMRDAGYDAVLVGTALMKSGDPSASLKAVHAALGTNK